MSITIAATKTCHIRPLLEKELQETGLAYTVKFFDEHPEIIEKFKVKTSPLLIVDGKLISVGMPEHGIIEDLKTRKTKK